MVISILQHTRGAAHATSTRSAISSHQGALTLCTTSITEHFVLSSQQGQHLIMQHSFGICNEALILISA